MTNDKLSTHSAELMLPSVSKFQSSCTRARIIQKHFKSKQQKCLIKRKCPMMQQCKYQKKAELEEMESSHDSQEQVQQSSNQQGQLKSCEDVIKQEDPANETNSGKFNSPSNSSINSDAAPLQSFTRESSFQQQEAHIKSRVCQEPVLFLHNKWDILPNQDYNIFGDILIETDFISDKKFSSQNHWKPPLKIEILHKKMFIKMDIGSYGQTLKEFSIISNFMKMCNHDEIQLYACNLDKWQEITKRLILYKQSHSSLINSVSNEDKESNLIQPFPKINDCIQEDPIEYSKKFEDFELKCEKKLDSLNSQGKILWYSKKKFNYSTQNLEEYECGFNQYLLAIMGCESEHLPTIIMRQGRPNFFDTKSRLKISQQLVLNYLNINLKVEQQISECCEFIRKINLITFDDLSVPSTSSSYCLNFLEKNNKSNDYNSNDSIFESSYDFILQIVELDIDPQHIQELINFREFNDHHHKLQELKENIQYEFDIHILIQKYYSSPINSSKEFHTS